MNITRVLLGLLGKVSKFFSFSSQLTIKFLSSSSLLLLLVGRILAISLKTEWTLSSKSALLSNESKSETKQNQNNWFKMKTLSNMKKKKFTHIYYLNPKNYTRRKNFVPIPVNSSQCPSWNHTKIEPFLNTGISSFQYF